MTKSIMTILKISLITTVSFGALIILGEFLGILDYSLLYWANIFLNSITFQFETIFNYANVWLVLSYILVRDSLFFALGLIFKRGA